MSQSVAKLWRYYETLRTLRWQQISNRIQRKLFAPSIRPRQGAKMHRIDGWTIPIGKTRHLTNEGELRIFGIARAVEAPNLWMDDSVPALWLYHVHYCDDVASNELSKEEKRWLIDLWIEGNQSYTGVGWDPYPISRRIVNWLKFDLSGGQLEQRAVDSIATQVDYLSRNLEFHLLGNHLLANLKALLFAGLIIDTPDAKKWTEQGRRLLSEQLAEQILPDGGHHELSPMYHAVVLEDLLDLINLGKMTHPELAADLEPVCARMLDWLFVMTHPDGGIAFFNDATLNGCASTAHIADYLNRLGLIQDDTRDHDQFRAGVWDLKESGYVRMSAGPMTLIADIAPVGPPHIPGHAHADTLSFELSVCGQRVIVNSGTSTYENSAERHRQRSTAAHNTVVIAGENSSDVWSAFRVGSRATVSDRQIVQSRNRLKASGGHNGYAQRFDIIHSRHFELSNDLLTLRDKLTGQGNHDIEWLMHLHPSVIHEKVRSGKFQLKLPDSLGILTVDFDEKLDVRPVESRYHPGFGCEVISTKLIATANIKLPCELTVTIRYNQNINGTSINPKEHCARVASH